MDAIVHVVRCFEDENIIHVDGSIDPKRDIEVIELELIFADLETMERRVDKAQHMLKGGDKRVAQEVELGTRLKAHLEAGKPVRTFPMTDDEKAIVDSWFLLTDKPVIYAANIADSDIGPDMDEIPLSRLCVKWPRQRGRRSLPSARRLRKKSHRWIRRKSRSF